MGPIVFLLLPALGCASITVTIKASAAENQAFITHYGKDDNIITDIEREAFNITNTKLTSTTEVHSGGRPTNVFVRSPTPWGDLYKTYNWREVHRETKVKQDRILAVKTEEVTLFKGGYTNNSTLTSQFTTNYQQVVDNKISNVFTGKALSVNVSYNVDLLMGLDPAIHLKFVSKLGNNSELTDTRTFNPSSDVTFTLKPSQSATAVLKATKVTMVVQVTYETSVSGDVAANYDPKYKGHHFWAYDVKAVLRSAKQPSVLKAIDVVTIQYYTDAKIEVADSESSNVIKSEKAGY